MKKRVALGAGLLLTLGTALAGTLMYSGGSSEPFESYATDEVGPSASTEISEDTIALWKATAVSMDYTAPKVPI